MITLETGDFGPSDVVSIFSISELLKTLFKFEKHELMDFETIRTFFRISDVKKLKTLF